MLTEETKDSAHLPGDDAIRRFGSRRRGRSVKLRTAKPAGSGNIVDAELLRPLSWLAENCVVGGRSIRLALPELGIDAAADVLAVEPCPEIEAGRGRVVTGTFRMKNSQVLDVRFAETTETLEPTPSHLIFSEDRQCYVRAEELVAGERVRTRCRRTLSIASTCLQAESQPVYNCEVEREHHYYVGRSGVLAHNACTSYFQGSAGNAAVDSVANEIEASATQAQSILAAGGTGGTPWGTIYQWVKGSGSWFEAVAKGNALQQVTDKLLRANPITSTLIDNGQLILNKGSMVGTLSPKGFILRPDYQFDLGGGNWAVFDLTTFGQQLKIGKYANSSVPYLVNVLY